MTAVAAEKSALIAGADIVGAVAPSLVALGARDPTRILSHVLCSDESKRNESADSRLLLGFPLC